MLLTVPPNDTIDYMVVVGVNDQELKREHRLVANPSCTTNCLAPWSTTGDRLVHVILPDRGADDRMDFRGQLLGRGLPVP